MDIATHVKLHMGRFCSLAKYLFVLIHIGTLLQKRECSVYFIDAEAAMTLCHFPYIGYFLYSKHKRNFYGKNDRVI